MCNIKNLNSLAPTRCGNNLESEIINHIIHEHFLWSCSQNTFDGKSTLVHVRLGDCMQQGNTVANIDTNCCHHMISLGQTELITCAQGISSTHVVKDYYHKNRLIMVSNIQYTNFDFN